MLAQHLDQMILGAKQAGLKPSKLYMSRQACRDLRDEVIAMSGSKTGRLILPPEEVGRSIESYQGVPITVSEDAESVYLVSDGS